MVRAAWVAALCCGLALPAILIVCQRFGLLLDRPNERSSHQKPRVRGGGIGILLGVAAGLLAAGAFGSPGNPLEPLLAACLLLALVSLADDLWSLSVIPRFLTQLLCAAFVVWKLGGLERLPLPAPLDLRLGFLAGPLAVLWIVGVTNAFNFMDGIDGLAGGEAVAVCAGAIVAGWSTDASLLASALAGAVLVFLVFNWSPSRLFLGDVGSIPVGFLLAGLPLLAPSERRPDAVLAAAIALALFLFDPFETVLRRWRQGKPLGESHREHRYQQLVLPGEPHGSISAFLVLAGLALSQVGALVYRRPSWGWFGVAAALAAFLLELAAVSRSGRGRPAASAPAL